MIVFWRYIRLLNILRLFNIFQILQKCIFSRGNEIIFTDSETNPDYSWSFIITSVLLLSKLRILHFRKSGSRVITNVLNRHLTFFLLQKMKDSKINQISRSVRGQCGFYSQMIQFFARKIRFCSKMNQIFD